MTAETARLLAGLLTLVQTGLALAVVITCITALRRRTTGHDGLEARAALPAALAGALVVVAAVGWPAYVAYLSALVPLVDGAYCLAGVRGLGAGADGAAGALPTVAAALDWTKPLAPALGVAAWLLARAQRTATGWGLLPWAVGALLLAGAAGLVDGALEGIYLLVPKDVTPPPAGCCSVATLPVEKMAAPVPLAAVWVPFLLLAGGALRTSFSSGRPALRRATVGGLALLSVVTAVTATLALQAFAASSLLGLRFHACLACVIEQRPETALIPAGLALGAAAFVGAFLLSLASRPAESFDAPVRGALLLGLFGFLGSAVVFLASWLTAPVLAGVAAGAVG